MATLAIKFVINILVGLSLSILVWLFTASLIYAFLTWIACLCVIPLFFNEKNENEKNIVELDLDGKRQVSRTYNQFGEIVESRYTELISSGHWATFITRNNGECLIEHVRTEENWSRKEFGSMREEEARHNRQIVFGPRYGKKRFIQRFKNGNR